MEALPNKTTSGRAGSSVTIADVARRAGVGAGTVSRVLNDSSLVAEDTRQRVLAVIEELEYRPSQVARNLSLGRTSSIAAVVPFLTHASAVERLRGFVRVLTSSRYDVALHDVEFPEQRDAHLRSLSARGRADGVVVVSLPPADDEVALFAQSGVPLVLLDAYHPSVTNIVTDNRWGGQLAVRHLIGLGHRKIAFIGDTAVNPYRFTSSADRRAGYGAALAERGIALEPAYVREGSHDRDVAGRLALELMALAEPPSAIFVASDTQALGVLDALRGAGLSVPRDVSVVGFDDIEVARYVGLTTVRQPLEESGARAAELMLAGLAGKEHGRTSEVLEIRLVKRETTAPPAP